ncbi:SnoaL-like domain [Yersinia frederiksenii]|uniref:SnoaL-like domain n=2 Tax=Yersinia frederiksenii TaxID=29484 RepID=A0A380PU54_YERFR|nr:nuclear transport factor 2 family protein [Yersinia frederiksenii]ATM94541.1 nuclear transport factor 2 family protein [Yersinia frederiksenii]KGA48569.1 nuclear transport factor 2 domain protein [Yersinia frederiksenii ATCC 33641]SUP76943.1 SnoaL-like domain [Yersinia frederiksenii]
MSNAEALLARFSQFYTTLDIARLANLSDVYHRDIYFVDPVGEHQGLSSLEAYFQLLISNLSTCSFTLTDIQHHEQQATVCWHMTYSHPRLRRGSLLSLEGISQLRFAEQRVIYQRDYYDLGAMLYEHIPLLGGVVVKLKKRLRA